MADDRAFYDDLETRSPDDREQALMSALPNQIALAVERSTYYSNLLNGIDPPSIDSRSALAQLPVTRKSDLIDRQDTDPPFGGLNAVPLAEVPLIFQSPGPIYEPGGDSPDFWRFARSFWAAGMRRGDIVHNTFSYHLTPAGRMMESAARAIGCPVFAGGVGHTELQLATIGHITAIRLCRHALLPQDPSGQGRRNGYRHHQHHEGRCGRRGLAAQPAR